ncbi:MAG: hypothetical protein ACREDK_06765 [Thermoplasmata archaeon]
MAEPLDALILGGGVDGTSAALALAPTGARVQVVDAAPSAAAVAGARVGPRRTVASLGALAPEEDGPLPLERAIVERRWILLDARSAVSVDERCADAPSDPSSWWTVRDAVVASWAEPKLRRAGVAVRWGGHATRLSRDEDGVVTGAVIDGADVPSHVTIVAEGAGHLLGPSDPAPERWERHAWSTYPMAADQLQRRFAVGASTGAAFDAILGFVPPPTMARGYLWTHRDAITVGVVGRSRTPWDARSLLDAFRRHPSIARYIGGATSLEDGERAVPLPGNLRLGGPGYLVLGRDAGLVHGTGAVHDGLGPCVQSGIASAAAIRATRNASVGSPRLLREYRRALDRSGLIAERARSLRASGRVEWNPRLHRTYPTALAAVLHRVMTETGAPKEALRAAILGGLRDAGVRRRDLAWDALVAGVSI